MNVSLGRPEFAPSRLVETPKSYELVAALKTNPVGWWVNIHLDELPGNSTVSKQRFVTRSARKHFKSVQVHREGARMYVRRIPDPRVMAEAQPWPDELYYRPVSTSAA
jgi:hypothetical protein